MSVSNLAKQRGKILEEILRHHREQLPRLMRDTPLEDLRAFASVAPPTVDVTAALRRPHLALVAACQKASPVRGLLARPYAAPAQARLYTQAGATAVAVWTDARHYQGQLADLRDVRESLRPKFPVIRHDFIFDPYQVYESRVAGADGILLLAAALGAGELQALAQLARRLGMTPIVDVHTPDELARALAAEPPILYLNRRSWHTFEVEEDVVARLLPAVPPGVLALAAGGIHTAADVRALRQTGATAVLLGEALARHKAPQQFLRELLAAG
ncbi:MAG: indole-3-glycerol-phosphate synthase [Anaerolineales bacterium]|nr:indole-3-glycerol-phosphate synthase [Anaerolineales bacterium]